MLLETLSLSVATCVAGTMKIIFLTLETVSDAFIFKSRGAATLFSKSCLHSRAIATSSHLRQLNVGWNIVLARFSRRAGARGFGQVDEELECDGSGFMREEGLGTRRQETWRKPGMGQGRRDLLV